MGHVTLKAVLKIVDISALNCDENIYRKQEIVFLSPCYLCGLSLAFVHITYHYQCQYAQ